MTDFYTDLKTGKEGEQLFAATMAARGHTVIDVSNDQSYRNKRPHAFKGVPINVYQNNQEELGDFENVISLIDAYDAISSDSINEFNYFSDCYLALYGMSGTEAEDIAAMKEQRVLLLETDAKAEWLTKNINDTYVNNDGRYSVLFLSLAK